MEKTSHLMREQFTMIDFKYRNWLIKCWAINGGLIPQAMAARLLGKTPTRIRQMINENKINAFTFNDESPLVSFAEIMKIFDEEELKQNKEYLSDEEGLIERFEEEKQTKEEAEKEAIEYTIFWNSLTPEEREEFQQLNECKKQKKIKAHFLQEQIEKLEEEKAQLQIEQQELEQELNNR